MVKVYTSVIIELNNELCFKAKVQLIPTDKCMTLNSKFRILNDIKLCLRGSDGHMYGYTDPSKAIKRYIKKRYKDIILDMAKQQLKENGFIDKTNKWMMDGEEHG